MLSLVRLSRWRGLTQRQPGRALPPGGEEHGLVNSKEKMANAVRQVRLLWRMEVEEARASLYSLHWVSNATPVSVNQPQPGFSNHEDEEESSLSRQYPLLASYLIHAQRYLKK